MLEVTGLTDDGRLSLSGVFKLEDTHGIPLPLALGLLKNSNLIPNWMDFYKQARENGWKHKTVISKLSEAIAEVYGPEFRDVVIGRLEHYYGSGKRFTSHL